MRDELRRADERHEVLAAASAWRAEGAIDEATVAVIRTRYPDDRRRARPAFRALFFLFTVLAGFALWGFGIAFSDIGLFGGGGAGRHLVLLVVLAAGAAAGATRALGPLRLRGFGVEEGLAALALGFEAGAVAVALDMLDVGGGSFALGFGANLAAVALSAAWRWGIPATGAVAAGGLFVALAGLTPVRPLWTGAAIVLATVARHVARSAPFLRSAPAHRARADEVRIVALAALYLSLHPALAVARGFGWAASAATDAFPAPSTTLALLGWFAIFVLPALLVVRGLREHDRLELALGALGLLASGAALGERIHLVPVWAKLMVAGAALGALVLLLRAAFDRRPDRTLAGFTDRPLGAGSDGHWLELAAALAAFAPAPRRVEEPPAFAGQGGDFGGGGASARF